MAAPFSHLCVTFDLEGVDRVAKYDNHPEDDFLQDGAVCGGVRDCNRSVTEEINFFKNI